jgi:hypothetical protein
MMTGNEPGAYISGFHLDALTSGVPLNVDLDTTLTVVAGNLCRLLALRLSQYENATPDRIWRHFLDATRHPAHHPGQRHLRTEPAQPPPSPHRRRPRRPRSPHPLAGKPHPPVPVPATMITRHQETSTQLPDRESRLAVMNRVRKAAIRRLVRAPRSPPGSRGCQTGIVTLPVGDTGIEPVTPALSTQCSPAELIARDDRSLSDRDALSR